MKLIKNEITQGKTCEGRVKVSPEESDDMYLLYNIITKGDIVTAFTTRNVVKSFSTGATTKNKVKMTLAVSVDKIEFDSEQISLRIAGKTVEENDFMKKGQYHTIEIELSQELWIYKEDWDQIYRDKLQEALDPAKTSDMAAIVMQEGLCHICLITRSMTITKLRIEKKMPKKKLV